MQKQRILKMPIKYIRPFSRFFAFYAFILMHLCCLPRNNTGSQTQPTEFTSIPEESRSIEDSKASFSLVEKGDIAVLSESLKLSIKPFLLEHKVPTLEMEFSKNDYVQILRCQAVFRSPLIRRIERSQPLGQDAMRFVWLDSIGDLNHCNLVTRRNNSTEFSDISAPNGTFFYIINPCISDSWAVGGEGGCSHRLVVTEDITYEDAPARHLQSLVVELSNAESEYDGLISKAMGLVRAIVDRRSLCQSFFKGEEMLKKDFEILWNVLSAGASGAAAFAARSTLLNKDFFKNSGYRKAYENLKISSQWSQVKRLWPSFNKNLITAGIFAGGLAIGELFKSRTITKTTSDGIGSCNEVVTLSKDLVELEDSQKLMIARNEINRITLEIGKVYSDFKAYNTKSFDFVE